jgi:hypothetical protein
MTLAHWYYLVEYKPRTRLLSAERSEGSAFLSFQGDNADASLRSEFVTFFDFWPFEGT